MLLERIQRGPDRLKEGVVPYLLLGVAYEVGDPPLRCLGAGGVTDPAKQLLEPVGRCRGKVTVLELPERFLLGVGPEFQEPVPR